MVNQLSLLDFVPPPVVAPKRIRLHRKPFCLLLVAQPWFAEWFAVWFGCEAMRQQRHQRHLELKAVFYLRCIGKHCLADPSFCDAILPWLLLLAPADVWLLRLMNLAIRAYSQPAAWREAHILYLFHLRQQVLEQMA